jgi:hypothetical protein
VTDDETKPLPDQDEKVPPPGPKGGAGGVALLELLRRHRAIAVAAAIGVVVGIAGTAMAVTIAANSPDAVAEATASADAGSATRGAVEQPKVVDPGPLPKATLTAPPPNTESCPPATVVVGDVNALNAALRSAQPGDSIQLLDGVYVGTFAASNAGTAEKPIFLCGGAAAIIDGDSIKGGYGLHLDGASYWRVVGFTVRNAQKGVMADRVQHALIKQLTVENIGDEAIHLRNFSSDNTVEGNTVRKTGQRRDTFGEGVYVGTAESNWCTITDCKPDLSDRNVIRDNVISETTAEAIDIKEGTTGGLVTGNTFEGGALSGSHNDSWVDVKGNGWLIKANTGRNSNADGFQTHKILDGWGTGNIFESNVAEVNGPGFGFYLAPVNGNVVRCDNRVTGAAKGFANVTCA